MPNQPTAAKDARKRMICTRTLLGKPWQPSVPIRGGFGTAEPMVSATFRDSCRARDPSAGGPLGNGVVHADGPGNLRDSESWRPTRGCAWGEHCRRSPVSFGRLARECARTAGWPQRCTPGSAFTESPGKCGQRGPSVAVRGIADGVHRPPQLCTLTVVTVHTDRPCSTDTRPLCVRGQRNMTIYSAPR